MLIHRLILNCVLVMLVCLFTVTNAETRVLCARLSLPNGTISLMQGADGINAVFSCRSGYRLTGSSAQSALCSSSKQWIFSNAQDVTAAAVAPECETVPTPSSSSNSVRDLRTSMSVNAIVVIPSTDSSSALRDRWQWPFARNSIWNMPIGSGAQYIDANLGIMGACNADNDLIFRENIADPSHQVIRHDHNWGQDGKGGTGKWIHIPDSWTYAGGPNNGAAFLDPDGHTIKTFAAFQREVIGSDPLAWDWGFDDVEGAGLSGGHAGSGMSAIGGSIRIGELTDSNPIRHALKVELDWMVLSPDWPGKYRWPAVNSDGYGSNAYSGTLKALTMGSLVALHSSFDIDTIQWRTPFGKKIAQAFQDYGAYVVDTTANGWRWGNGGLTWAICLQNEAIDEVKSTFGIDFRSGWGAGGTNWTADMQEIYKRLFVVDNNSPNTIGGGGTPRQLLAPDFAPSTATSQGCFLDSWQRVLPVLVATGNQMTPEKCQNQAKFQGLRYAGVEYAQECWGGNILPSIRHDQCNMPCTGSSSQTCGGGWAIEVFDLQGLIVSSNAVQTFGVDTVLGEDSSTGTTTTSHTSTSTSISKTLLGIIGACVAVTILLLCVGILVWRKHRTIATSTELVLVSVDSATRTVRNTI